MCKIWLREVPFYTELLMVDVVVGYVVSEEELEWIPW